MQISVHNLLSKAATDVPVPELGAQEESFEIELLNIEIFGVREVCWRCVLD